MAGFIIAIAAGWLVRDARKAAATVVVPWLGVVAVGTWLVAAGHDDSPPSTVSQFPQAIGFWAVQVVLLALLLGIAAMLGSLRARQDLSRGRAANAGRQAGIATAFLVAATAVFALVAVLGSDPVRHHSATGSPPLIEVAGWALSVLSFAAFAVVTIRRRRARDRRPASETASVTAGGAGG
jgi:cytochrome bd-type quinol oxidase subunit 2